MQKMLTALSEGLPLLGLELTDDVKQTLCAFGSGVVKQISILKNGRVLDDRLEERFSNETGERRRVASRISVVPLFLRNEKGNVERL